MCVFLLDSTALEAAVSLYRLGHLISSESNLTKRNTHKRAREIGIHFFFLATPCDIQDLSFPTRDLNPSLLQWKLRVLIIGPPGIPENSIHFLNQYLTLPFQCDYRCPRIVILLLPCQQENTPGFRWAHSCPATDYISQRPLQLVR